MTDQQLITKLKGVFERAAPLLDECTKRGLAINYKWTDGRLVLFDIHKRVFSLEAKPNGEATS